MNYAMPESSVGEMPLSPVFAALNGVDCALGDSHALLDALNARLDAVLGPLPQSQDKSANGPRPVGASPLVERIMSQAEVSRSVAIRLRDLLDRLTL